MSPGVRVPASVLSVLMVCTVVSVASSICEVDPFQKSVELDGRSVVVFGHSFAGSPEAARHEVRTGVCATFMVIGGIVLELAPVAVANTEDSTHTLLSVDVSRSWKAQLEGVQRIRLMEDFHEPSREHPRYPPLEEGDECLLYLVRDSFGELMAYPSLAIRDSVILGLWGVPQQISRDAVFALVDSCVADRSLDSMAARADLIIEGDVESSWEDWLGRLGLNRTACVANLTKLSVHKGSFPDSLLKLINVRGRRGWNAWPSFESGERVLLFLERDTMDRYELIGGWQGKWQLAADGVFHIGARSSPSSFGIVSLNEPVRPSVAPARTLSRSELAEALSDAVHTLSN